MLLDVKNITQAKAVRIHADKCAFFDCGFLGVQDTLNDDSGRHYYHNCYIQGGVDFIYGNGQSIFEVKLKLNLFHIPLIYNLLHRLKINMFGEYAGMYNIFFNGKIWSQI